MIERQYNGEKDKEGSTKHYIENQTLSNKNPISGTIGFTLVTNLVINHERGKGQIMITTNRIYHCETGKDHKTFEVILGTLCSVVCQHPIKEILIGTTSSRISYEMRYIYIYIHSLCRRFWNVATYNDEWKSSLLS